MLDDARLQQRLTAIFSNTMRVHSITGDDAIELNHEETCRFNAFVIDKRRQEWKRGRQALKGVLRKLGKDDDTSMITFPNRQLSLSHHADYAIAIGTNSGDIDGIGIDVESIRSLPANAYRFFMTKVEQDWLATCSNHDLKREAIRLWSIKEALFKADPENEGCGLYQYETRSAKDQRGCGKKTINDNLSFFYESLAINNGFLSVAICRKCS